MRKSKRKFRYNRNKKCHPFGSWLLLILSWILALPAISVVVFTVYNSMCSEPEAFVEVPEPVFSEAKQPDFEMQIDRFSALKTLRSDSPTVLIYHTHTTEAYYPTAENSYTPSSEWRTTDPSKNVIAVGEALKDILETQYGFCVIHDMTDHEPPKLTTAYDRSLITMQKYRETYPSIVLFIDLHRDAYKNVTQPTDYLTINGKETARLMFVVGKGEKYTEKPYLETNYALAERITHYLQTIDERLARPIRLKSGRYNQHVAPNCLLVEVGHNANTLEQAFAAMPYLAEGIAYAFPVRFKNGSWSPN